MRAAERQSVKGERRGWLCSNGRLNDRPELAQAIDHARREGATLIPPELLACHDRVRLLRGQRIGHHVARESGQEVSFYFGGEHPRRGELQITEFFVRVDTELYDTDLLDRL